MKLILFGGSFDPPHCGHLKIIEDCIKECDKLILMPSSYSPLKKNYPIAESKHRVKMLQLLTPDLKHQIQIDDSGIDVSTLEDGSHTLIINAIDKFGLQSSQTFDFVVDTKSPIIELLSQNNTAVSNRLDIQLSVDDQNLPKSNYLSLLLPNGERIVDQKSYSFDTSDLEEGEFSIGIFAQDEAKNSISSKIMFEIDHSIIDSTKPLISTTSSQTIESDTDYLLIIVIGIIAIVIVSVLVILKQKSKITQKN